MKQMTLFVVGMLLVVMWTGTAFAGDRFNFSKDTAKDKKTGLMWGRLASPLYGDWNEVSERLDDWNKNGKGVGYSDWRIPSKKELLTLVSYAKSAGYDGSTAARGPDVFLEKIGFYSVKKDAGFWTSSSIDDYRVWVVSLFNSRELELDKTSAFYAWPVRGRQK